MDTVTPELRAALERLAPVMAIAFQESVRNPAFMERYNEWRREHDNHQERQERRA